MSMVLDSEDDGLRVIYNEKTNVTQHQPSIHSTASTLLDRKKG